LEAAASLQLFLVGVEHLPAGLAELIGLPPQAGDDATIAGDRADAEFVVIGLAGGALLRRRPERLNLRLCKGHMGAACDNARQDGARQDGDNQDSEA
jgi:hypothetical protein